MINTQIFDNSKQHLDNKDIARILLMNAMGKVLANPEQYAADIFAMSYHYMMKGDIAKNNYEKLVNHLIEDEETRKELL